MHDCVRCQSLAITPSHYYDSENTGDLRRRWKTADRPHYEGAVVGCFVMASDIGGTLAPSKRDVEELVGGREPVYRVVHIS